MSNVEADAIKLLASEYKQKLQDKQSKGVVDLENEKIVKSDGPKRWAELRQKIKDTVDKLNSEFGHTAISWDDPHADRIQMTRVEGSVKLEGGFDEAISIAFFRCPQAKIDLQLHLVVQEGKLEFVAVNPSTKLSYVNRPEDISYGLVRDLLNC